MDKRELDLFRFMIYYTYHGCVLYGTSNVKWECLCGSILLDF